MKGKRDELSVSPIGAAVTSLVREMSMGRRRAHAEIWARWRDIVGPEVYRKSFPVSLRGRTLVVGVVSSPWLQEMSFLKTPLLDRLAEEIGPGVVSDIRFVLDPAVAAADAVGARGVDGVAPPPPDPAIIPPALRAEIDRLEDGELRAAVERAISAGLAARERR